MNNSLDKFVLAVIFAGIMIVMFYVIFLWTPAQLKRVDAARQWATQNNCEYLGSPRDLNTVMFFDCNGVISVQRFAP
jgi:hypothetical protein